MHQKLKSIVKGQVLDITSCKDEVFAEKILGDGLMIKPSSQTIKAPFSGQIKTVTESMHAITMTSSDGISIIIHVGIDTVEMNGNGFIKKVENGDLVEAGQDLLEVDFDLIEQNGYDTSVLLIVLDKDVSIEKKSIDMFVDETTTIMEVSK